MKKSILVAVMALGLVGYSFNARAQQFNGETNPVTKVSTFVSDDVIEIPEIAVCITWNATTKTMTMLKQSNARVHRISLNGKTKSMHAEAYKMFYQASLPILTPEMKKAYEIGGVVGTYGSVTTLILSPEKGVNAEIAETPFLMRLRITKDDGTILGDYEWR